MFKKKIGNKNRRGDILLEDIVSTSILTSACARLGHAEFRRGIEKPLGFAYVQKKFLRKQTGL